jgi:hypothetical protein
MTGRRPPLRACALLLSLASALVTAAVPAPPGWEVLEFEQRGFGITARSRLELSEDSANGCGLALTAESSIASNLELLSLCMDPVTYRLLQRSRLSRGRDQRYKSWTYEPGHILRERREPGRDASRPPQEWQLSSRREVPYPEAAGDLTVTGAYALLPLAGRFLAGGAASADVIVHTDLNFYRVRMTRGASSKVPVDYRLLEDNTAVSGKRETQAVVLQASPVGTPADKPDFSLLGLDGEITVQFDPLTGVPLQLRGRAPRIGSATINLKAVRMRAAEE